MPQVNPVITYATLVGKVLHQLRKDRNVEQKVIADALGITQSAYSRLESGNSTFSVTQLRIAANVIGVCPNHILLQADSWEAQLRAQGQVEVVNEKSADPAASMIGLGILIALLASLK